MRLSVIGAGTMGQGIVSLLAYESSVSEIVWIVRDPERATGYLGRITRDLKKIARRNSKDENSILEMLDRVSITDSFEAVNRCELIIEAIAEDINEKKSLLGNLDGYLDSNAIVASNTSSVSITDLASSLSRPDRMVGVHFFNPPLLMSLVEIVAGLRTSDETIDYVNCFVRALKKKPVLVNDSPGFVVNRMLIPMINEAVSILAEGVADRDAIDEAMLNGANHPLGPLKLADLIGLDVCLSIMETLHSETGDPKYRANALLRKYVRAGRLGRKVKAGFYDY